MKKFLFAVVVGVGVIGAVIFARNVLWAEAPTTAHTVSIGWVGDIVPSDNTSYNAHVFDSVATALAKPDLMMGNLEGTFATPDRVSKCTVLSTDCYAFRGDPTFAGVLRSTGFDFVSLVNNHSYDYYLDGLNDTQAVLTSAGFPSISPTSPTASITVHGYRIGILGLASSGAIHTLTDYAFITSQVKTLRQTNDFVIVIFHGGAEGADETAVTGSEEYEGSEDRGNVSLAAHTAIDAGADVVLGSGPHVLRKIEYYKGGLIAYSLGNFEGGDGALSTSDILGTSGIITVTLSPNAPPTYTFTSVALSPDGTPSLDPTGAGAQLIKILGK